MQRNNKSLTLFTF